MVRPTKTPAGVLGTDIDAEAAHPAGEGEKLEQPVTTAAHRGWWPVITRSLELRGLCAETHRPLWPRSVLQRLCGGNIRV